MKKNRKCNAKRLFSRENQNKEKKKKRKRVKKRRIPQKYLV